MSTIYLLTADNHGDYESFKKIVQQVKKDYFGKKIIICNLGDFNNWKNNGKNWSKDGSEYVGWIDENGDEHYEIMNGYEPLYGNHFLNGISVDIDEELKKIEDVNELSEKFNKKYFGKLSREEIVTNFCKYFTIVTENGTKILLLHAPVYDFDKNYDMYAAYGYHGIESKNEHMKLTQAIIEKEKPDYIVGAHTHDPIEREVGTINNWYNTRIHTIGSASSWAPRDSKNHNINYAIIDENGDIFDKVL